MNKGYKNSETKTALKGYDGPSMQPTLTLTTKDLPDIKNWKVGKTYDLELTVKQTGLHQYTDGEPMTASFDVTSVQVDNDADEGEE